MISIKDILKLHELSITKYGGSHGIRDIGLLESAVARPFQTFGGQDLYPSYLEKAAAILESIILNHPFVDGNKRTGFLAMFAVLKIGHINLEVKEDDAYKFIISIATGELPFAQIVDWLKDNSSPA